MTLFENAEAQQLSSPNFKVRSPFQYWRNRLVKFAKEKTDRLMYSYNFCMGERRHFQVRAIPKFANCEFVIFQSLVFNELGGNAGWAQESPKVVLWDKNWRSFVMEEALDSALLNLSQFLKNFEAGNLRPFIKSETPPPEAQKAGDHVKVAVGTTFNKIVLDTRKVANREKSKPQIIDFRTRSSPLSHKTADTVRQGSKNWTKN